MNAEQVWDNAVNEAKVLSALMPVMKWMSDEPIEAAKTFTMTVKRYKEFMEALNKIGNLYESTHVNEAKTIAREVLRG